MKIIILNLYKSLKFPHGRTPVMKKIIFFHEKCLLVIIIVLVPVLIILLYNLYKTFRSVTNLENINFEILWTIVPSIIIIMLMVPSLELLYFSEETGGAFFANKLKVVGHQWYWSYEEEFISEETTRRIKFDSYIIKEKDLNPGEFRKCEVDKPVIFETNRPTRMLITSADSIHSWSIPEFGVKVDAVPGRLNQVVIFTQEPGRFFGFCSELCGVNHRFMPIVAEVIHLDRVNF